MIIPLNYVRLFVDDAGLSHFEECTLPLATHNFAPPTTLRTNLAEAGDFHVEENLASDALQVRAHRGHNQQCAN